MISPSLQYLSTIKFFSAELDCVTDEDKEIKISVVSKNDSIEINVKYWEKSHIDSFIRSNVFSLNESIHNDLDERQRFELEKFDSLEPIKIIKSFTTPQFLWLDRRVYSWRQIDEIGRQSLVMRRRYRDVSLSEPLNFSLIDLQEEIFSYVRVNASKQLVISKDFKTNIIKQSFEFESEVWKLTFPTNEELDKMRANALKAFENLEIWREFDNNVIAFFNKLKKTLKNIPLKKIKEKINLDENEFESVREWLNNQPQLKKIDTLIDLNQAYQSQLELLNRPFEKIKNIVNKFFNESWKEFWIDPEGEISVSIPKYDRTMRITELSSWEKQIIAMLWQLIFFEEKHDHKNENWIFIIDEPELSLHLSWQQIFTSSILEASPNTQFILATHSPEIIWENDKVWIVQDLASKIL